MAQPGRVTSAAMAALALRFDLPQHEHMQDWEYEVADSERIGEFLDAYLSEPLTADERFVLMEIIVQSSEDHPAPLSAQPRWGEVVESLRANVALHATTISYWACVDEPSQPLEELWRVTQAMRELVAELPDRSHP